ncbi:MAG: type II toxin-antitoxin system RelE/ParE family toxin [Thermoplasmata archaeon]|nr:type II toxin-antitoxin system RelE/ParE family toxin [Thermoplasmata archaeon]
MTFEIIWSQSTLKQLKKLDRSVAKRIVDAVDKLLVDPHRVVSRIVNSSYFRLRVGDYRVLVDIQRKELRVLVLKVGHRKSVYDRDTG